MNIDNIMNFFYSRISERVKIRILESGLTQEKIHKNQKLISKIINNKRDYHNRFLIIDSVFYNTMKDEETGESRSCGLLGSKELYFKNEQEILWGTETEIKSYMYDLFEHLLNEVFNDSSDYNIDIEHYLCDYIPYSINSTYWNVISNNKFPALYYGVREDDIIPNMYRARDEAIHILYNKCASDFSEGFINFQKEINSFRGIDKKFKTDFIDTIFVPLIRKNPPPETSLGLRIRELIYADLSHCASLVAGEVTSNTEYIMALINASSRYVLALENIHNMFLQEKRNGTD